MKNEGKTQSEATAEMRCDACQRASEEGEHQFATLKAGYGTQDAAERYELHLCKSCFSGTLAYIKRERFVHRMFDDDYDTASDDRLGMVIDRTEGS